IVTSPEPDPPQQPAVPRVAAVADGAPAISIEDHLESRVRLPADALRCVVECAEIALLVGLEIGRASCRERVYRRVLSQSQPPPRRSLSKIIWSRASGCQPMRCAASSSVPRLPCWSAL